ncbi:MAG: phage tail terminator-like protein [Pseudomonadota bacterium]
MSDAIIRSAIEGRLKTWAQAQTPAIPIAFANSGYRPVTGQRYLSGTLVPAITLNPSQGGKHKRYHGFYQVDVRVPDGGGTGDISTIAKAIEVLFECPTTIPKDGLNVHINRTPSTGPGASDGAGFYMVPVTVWYDLDDFS